MKDRYIAVMVMCGSVKEAERLVDSLLKKRLIACANILPGVQSRFWWKGSLDKAREVLVIAKSIRGKFAKIDTEVRRLHSYDVPEIIALPIAQGSRKYLGWMEDAVSA